MRPSAVQVTAFLCLAVAVFVGVWKVLTVLTAAPSTQVPVPAVVPPSASVPARASTPAAVVAAPHTTPLEAILRRAAAGEALAGAECVAVGDPLIEAAFDARMWPVIACQWAADRPTGARAMFIQYVRMRGANGTLPPEREALLNDALLFLADHPPVLVGDVLTRRELSLERTNMETLLLALEGVRDLCARCASRPALREAIRTLKGRIESFPVSVANVAQLQLRHPDLRGRLVRLRGFVLADTYYNCKYRSSSQWRGMRLKDALRDFRNMHVYCRRGDAVCDSVYEIATTGNLEGTALVRYPESNSVCEESQAELVDFIADE